MKIAIQLLKKSDFKKMPWKNGKGVTDEIAIFPPTATLQENNFLWRLSSSEILEDCAFSSFPSFERALVLVEGEELSLLVSGVQHELSLGSVLLFSGAETVDCKLNHGRVRDLNLFTRRGAFRADVQILNQSTQAQIFPGMTYFIFVILGRVGLEVEASGGLDNRFIAEAHETLIMTSEDQMSADSILSDVFRLRSEGGTFVLMALTRDTNAGTMP